MKTTTHHIFLFLCLLVVVTFSSCSSCGNCEENDPFVGQWRGVLDACGKDLCFFISIKKNEDGSLRAAVLNGEESLPFTTATVKGRFIQLDFAHYDSMLEGELNPMGDKIEGRWIRAHWDEGRQVPFYALKDAKTRFPLSGSNPPQGQDLSGQWTVVFDFGGGGWKSNAILKQNGAFIKATFQTSVGDFRFIDGVVEDGLIRMSCFDGAHAFLFHANINKDGTLKGEFCSGGGKNPSPWTATKGHYEMPDPLTITYITNDNKTFSFELPDIKGNNVTSKDPRFAGKPLMVCILGTWCPNCHDAGALWSELYRKYHSKGLEAIGIACGYYDSFEKCAEMARRFTGMYKIDWPFLIIETSSKQKVAETLTDLNKVHSYPTTIFIDKKGKVQKIYTGFNGPATGDYFVKMKDEFNQTIEGLLLN